MLIFALLIAVAVYFLVRALQERGDLGQLRPRSSRRPQQPRRIVAPDDDEDFLRDLDRKRREPEDPDAG